MCTLRDFVRFVYIFWVSLFGFAAIFCYLVRFRVFSCDFTFFCSLFCGFVCFGCDFAVRLCAFLRFCQILSGFCVILCDLMWFCVILWWLFLCVCSESGIIVISPKWPVNPSFPARSMCAVEFPTIGIVFAPNTHNNFNNDVSQATSTPQPLHPFPEHVCRHVEWGTTSTCEYATTDIWHFDILHPEHRAYTPYSVQVCTRYMAPKYTKRFELIHVS